MVEVKFFLSIFLLIIVPFVIGSSNKTTFKELIQSFEAKDQWEETILNHCDTKTDKLFFNQSTGTLRIFFWICIWVSPGDRIVEKGDPP